MLSFFHVSSRNPCDISCPQSYTSTFHNAQWFPDAQCKPKPELKRIMAEQELEGQMGSLQCRSIENKPQTLGGNSAEVEDSVLVNLTAVWLLCSVSWAPFCLFQSRKQFNTEFRMCWRICSLVQIINAWEQLLLLSTWHILLSHRSIFSSANRSIPCSVKSAWAKVCFRRIQRDFL